MEASRKPYLAGNWKMHKQEKDLVPYLEEFSHYCDVSLEKMLEKVDIMLAVPHILLAPARSLLGVKGVDIAAQNFFWEPCGAYTGETSARMLKDVGIAFSLVGHSERRKLFKETNEDIQKKIKASLALGIKPILCVGEEQSSRESGQAYDVVEAQLLSALDGVSEIQSVIVAYEPVWAIGTGLSASPQEAQKMHAFIRKFIGRTYGEKSARGIKILYGGSMNSGVVEELVAMKDIDGGLVGSAALSAKSFAQMANVIYHRS